MATPDSFATRDALAGWMQDIAPYGIFTTDADLIVQSWNEWLVLHSGLGAEAVMGRPLLEVIPDLQARRLDQNFARALRGEVSVLSAALHKFLLPLSAAARGFSLPNMLQTVRIAPLTVEGNVVGTVTIVEDVTQRECQAAILRRQHEHDRLLSDALALLLRSERPLEIVSELFPRIAVSLKLDVYFNYLLTENSELQLHSASGVTPEVRKSIAVLPLGESLCGQVAERHVPLVVSQVHLDDSAPASEMRRLGLRSYAGFPLLIGDRVIGTLSFGSYVHDDFAPDDVEFLAKIAQYVAISFDRAIRERDLRHAQERLSQHAGELELKIAERTSKLQETIAQLESFSYTIAHDLRAPIRSLNGFTEILLSDHSASVSEDGLMIMRRLVRASHRLDALTRDLLKFSQVARQDVKLDRVDLDELVQDIVSVTSALQDGVLSVQEPLGTVVAQRTLLQQCLSNLFDNALKFIAPGRHLSLVVRSELRTSPTPGPRSVQHAAFCPSTTGAVILEEPRRRIWIEDNGIGIPAGAHDKIFGIFERIPGLTPVEGTGIGLAIVARATEQMGGSCGVESTPGEGSRFWLEFALAD